MKKGIAGIDLGTTFSCMATLGPDEKPMLIPDAVLRNSFFSPSCIWFSGNGGALAGLQAEAVLEQNPEAMLWSFFKRSFGKNEPFTFSNGAAWQAESLGALMLKKLKNDFLVSTRRPLEAAVVTVPAHFNDLQRKAVKYAVDMAEMELLDLIEEPVAAALHYGATRDRAGQGEVFFIYDLGGGTFDATVMTFDSGKAKVLAKDGHTELGGKEFDEQIMVLINEAFSQKYGDSYRPTAYSKILLRRMAEEIKKALSLPENAFFRKRVTLGDWSMEIIFERSKFEARIREAIDRTVDISRRCIAQSGLSIEDVDAFLLVGGSAQIPLVRQLLAERLQIAPEKLRLHEPERAVAFGAALYSAMLTGEKTAFELPAEFRGVTGHHVGIRTFDPRTGQPAIEALIRKNMELPASKLRTFHTRSAEQTYMAIEVVQFLDNPSDAFSIGTLEVGPLPSPKINYPIETLVEYQTDGTLRVRAFDALNGGTFTQTFSAHTEESQLMLRQKAIVKSTPVNGGF